MVTLHHTNMVPTLEHIRARRNSKNPRFDIRKHAGMVLNFAQARFRTIRERSFRGYAFFYLGCAGGANSGPDFDAC